METLKCTNKPFYKVYKEDSSPYRIKYKGKWVDAIFYNYFDAKDKVIELLENGARYATIEEVVVHSFMEKKVWVN